MLKPKKLRRAARSVGKAIEEGLERVGTATTRGATRQKGRRRNVVTKNDPKTGKLINITRGQRVRRGAGVTAAGAGAGAAGIAAASGSEKPKAKAKPSRRGPSLEEAGAKIKKSKEAFERRKRSNRQAESAMRSVQKSRALGEAAARDPKATKPMSPRTPPTSSVKQEREKAPKTRVAVERPTAPKVEVKPKVVRRAYATPKSNRKLVEKEKAAKRSAARSESRAKNFNVGVSKGGVSFKEAFRHFRNKGAKTFTWNGKKYTTELAKKAGGGMMKKKGMAMGGAMKKKGMSKGGAAKKFPDLTGDGKVTQADILKGRGVTKKKGGGMAKKGYAKGGMAKKGYAKGGPVRSKMSAKGGKRGGASRKPRGVGVALRGYGRLSKNKEKFCPIYKATSRISRRG
tara:strand:- start:230 stop:1429 length:1200 start_codon:yes stop_codon:yes gene_type:complete